jgi:plastocyanin
MTRRWRRGGAWLAPIVSLTLLAVPAASSAADTTVLSGQGGDRYSPAQVEITAGDTVTWRNVSGYHNVHGDGFQNTVSNEAWTFSHTFTSAGTYDYVCDVHPLMKGTVVVAAAAPAPSPTPTETASPSPTPTATPTASASPTATPTPTATPRATASPTVDPTPAATATVGTEDPTADAPAADEPGADDPGDDGDDGPVEDVGTDDEDDGLDGTTDADDEVTDDEGATDDEVRPEPTPLTAAPAAGSGDGGGLAALLALGVLLAGGLTAVLVRQRRRALDPD